MQREASGVRWSQTFGDPVYKGRQIGGMNAD